MILRSSHNIKECVRLCSRRFYRRHLSFEYYNATINRIRPISRLVAQQRYSLVATSSVNVTTSLSSCFSTMTNKTNTTAISDNNNDNNTSLVSTSNNHLPTNPIDFDVAAKVEGEESHVAIIELRPGETLRAESGAMLFMTDGVVMDTKLNGVSSAFNRMLTGQNMFLTDYKYEKSDGVGTVGLGTDFPSKILRFKLEDHPNNNLICQKGAYMASNPSVDIDMEFTKSLKAGFFGGQGFVLQKLSGIGDVLLKGGGTIVEKQLNENETIRVTSGSIVAFESSNTYDVQMIPGIQNVLFGKEGLFLTTLTGPGKVWLQGMPPDRMIAEIARRVPSGGGGIGLGIPIGGGGGGSGTGGDVDSAGTTDGVGDAAAAGSVVGGGEEAVAATDAAIEADRNATIATSGLSSSQDTATTIDADSPSALFGDAAPTDNNMSKPSITDDDATSFSTETTESSIFTESTEPTFTDDDTSFMSSQQQSETTFQDDMTDSGDFPNEDMNDGELFSDTPTSDSVGGGGGGDESSGSSDVFGFLWDLFTGGGDE